MTTSVVGMAYVYVVNVLFAWSDSSLNLRGLVGDSQFYQLKGNSHHFQYQSGRKYRKNPDEQKKSQFKSCFSSATVACQRFAAPS